MTLQVYTLALGNFRDDTSGNNYAANTPVYILNSGGTLADIFRDQAGAQPIAQDGLNNISDAYGEFTFYVNSGQYISRVAGRDRLINVVGSDYFDSRVDDAIEQITQQTLASRGFRVVGTFADGFTYELFNDVGIDSDGNSWIYVGSGAPNKVVSAGTVPSVGAGYEQVVFNTLQNLIGLDQPSDLDNYYGRKISEAETTINLKIGSRVYVTERESVFDVLPLGATVNGYNTLGFDTCVLSLSESFTLKKLGVQSGGNIASKLNDIIDIMISRGNAAGSRVKVESLGFDDGTYYIENTVNLKNIRDFLFYSVSGGRGSVIFDMSLMFSGVAFTATDAAFGKFSGITFKDIVDNDNEVYGIGTDTGLIRGWDWEDCDFIACKKPFHVSGNFLCSEFSFLRCDFLQCFTLMHNENIQAVNWNFISCNYENDSLSYAGSNSESTAFYCTKGTFVTWVGGSIIPQGALVRVAWDAAGSSFRTTNKIVFSGVRIEVSPTSGDDNPPLIDKVGSGYVTATNSMPVEILSSSILTRGGVQANYNLANIWDRSSLTIKNTPTSLCTITGVYTGATATAQGRLLIEGNAGITYVDDPTNKAFDYVNHSIKIRQDNSQFASALAIDIADAGTVVSESEKIVRLRSYTGRIPLANTSVSLPSLPAFATIVSIGYKRLQANNTSNSFTATLKSADGLVDFATVTLPNNSRSASSDVLLDVGLNIDSELKVDFSGAPDTAFGYFELRYI